MHEMIRGTKHHTLDIARFAGVLSTVSVMNGKDHDISEKTKEKYHRLIEVATYVPYSKFPEKEGPGNPPIGLVMCMIMRTRDHSSKYRKVAGGRRIRSGSQLAQN